VPFVVINRDLEPGLFNQIQFDDKGAGQHATRHLINLGHQRIGTICGPQKARRSAVARHEGWQDALASQGFPIVQDWIVDGEYTYEGGYRAAQRLLPIIRRAKEPPTALFIANDMMALGALWALQEAGLHIPQDLAIVTVGDPPFAAYTIPPLTTLALPVVKAGQVAARLLIDWLKYDKPAHNQHIVLDFDLKIRQSCGASLTL
jgi:DNA-binding LacI/PurR family transcriptional regulator